MRLRGGRGRKYQLVRRPYLAWGANMGRVLGMRCTVWLPLSIQGAMSGWFGREKPNGPGKEGAPSLSLLRDYCSRLFRPGLPSAVPCVYTQAGGGVVSPARGESLAELPQFIRSGAARD